MKKDSTCYITQALEELLKDKKLDEIHISEIIKKAGVGRGTFYRYFTSKDDVLRKYFQIKNNDFLSRMNFRPRCRADYYDITLEVFRGIKKNRTLIEALINSGRIDIFLTFLDKELHKTIMPQAEEESTWAIYFSHFLAGGLCNATIAWIQRNCKETENDIAKVFLSYIPFPPDFK